MRRIIDYDIVIGDSLGFIGCIKEKINNGWVPQGGVSVNLEGMLIQAVVKYEGNERDRLLNGVKEYFKTHTRSEIQKAWEDANVLEN